MNNKYYELKLTDEEYKLIIEKRTKEREEMYYKMFVRDLVNMLAEVIFENMEDRK